MEPVQRRISQVIDVGTTGGEWMFKQDEMLFGPLPARQLIQKLYAGEVSGDTLVAASDEEGNFSKLREVSFFTVHLAKAEARLRVQRDTDEFHSLERRGASRRTAVVVSLLLLAVFGAGAGGYALMLARQHRLEREVDEIPITAEPPQLAAAAAADDEVALPGEPAANGAAPGAVRRPRHGFGVAAPGAMAAHGSDGLAAINYDKNTLIGAEVRQKPQLIPCLRQQLGRQPDFRGDVRFTVAIGNDGKVAKLWMDDPQLKDSELQQCFQRTMEGWRFASYEGERATMSDSFHVGGPK